MFIFHRGKDFLLVQIYVDDIIFGALHEKYCTRFEKLMKKEFEMSDLGELKFFLGLQIKRGPDGISICQQKYVGDMLKRFEMLDAKPMKTPIEVGAKIGSGMGAPKVDQRGFREMIGSLLYLTATRPDMI